MQEKIKIHYIINSFSVGGAEKMLLDLVKKLDKSRYEIAVSTVTGSGPLEAEFEATGAKIFINHKKSKLGFDVVKKLRKDIEAFKPDVVHTHLWSGDFWGRWAALRQRVPLIISTEHNRNVEEGAFKKSAKHFLSYFTSVIIASSPAIKDYQVKKELISSKKIRVINYGIDLEKFPFRGVKVARYGENHLHFLTVGRLAYQKGQQFLIEAMARLAEEYPDIECKIYGNGEMKEELIDVAKRIHVNDKIVFAGLVSDVANVLKEADIFVLPSRYEGLGIVLLEAMAVGVPVIASDIPGVNEVVINEETGLLFEAENSDALVESIIKLLKNPELQKELIKNARKMVEEKYSLKRMVSDYDHLYSYLKGHRKAFEIKYM